MAQPVPPRKTFGTRHRDQADGSAEAPKQAADQWLRIADQAYQTSTSFVDNNYRADWENSIRHYQNKHAKGSKYLTDAYKYRSKHFRPKTRATVRQNEAAAAAAYFSQLEIMSVEPHDRQDPMQAGSAALRHELLNYRLTHDIPWFMICIGGMQNANVYGIVSSKQYWDYEEEMAEAALTDPSTGQPVTDAETGQPATTEVRKKVKDRPQIELWPAENLRFDPGADWTDVVNGSPYFIAIMPMYIGDVRAKIKGGEWSNVSDALLKQARNNVYDTTRQQRDGEKEDANESRYSAELSDFDRVWVHENFVRKDGKEVHYYTLGTVARLSEVRPLKEVYLHNVRPFVVGSCVIESHRAVPDSPVHLGKGLQKEANEVSNTRLDNVKLVLNKRYFARRGKQIDLQSLVRNAPGSVTLMNDPEKDVIAQEFTDVTSSSYAEQDRINVDMDELLGSFSAGSVQSNRKLNETVGGMNMLRGSSNQMTQYLVRTFTETWVEKVLHQLDLLEQFYEADMDVLSLMARRANLAKYGIEQITSDLLLQPADVTVNVANSAMDPMIRLEAFMQAITRYAEFSANAPPDIDREAVKAQIFGLLGYRDGRQFSIDPQGNPQLAAAMQQIDELTRQLEGKFAEAKAKQEGQAQIEAMRLESKGQTEMLSMQMEQRQHEMELVQQAQQAEADRRLQLIIAQMAEQTKIIVAEMTKSMQAQQEGERAARAESKAVQVLDSSAAPMLEGLSNAIVQMAAANQQALQTVTETVLQAMQGVAQAVQSAASMDREIVTDENGMPAGVRMVRKS